MTAVEWLIKEINRLTGTIINPDEPIIEAAKQMEKEQMKEIYIVGGQQGFLSAAEEEYMTFEQYYEKTYKNK